jgi:hypothetical protein
MRKTIVTMNGVIVKIKKHIETKRNGSGKKVGIPPNCNHAFADVQPYL